MGLGRGRGSWGRVRSRQKGGVRGRQGGDVGSWGHCKKESAVFPSPAGMSLIKLFLGGNNLVFPAQREFGQ